MTLSAPMRCSAVAEELDEPMIGTVDRRIRWLLIEDHGAWGTDAVADLIGRPGAASFKAGGVRVLLVRRREADPSVDAVRRLVLVDTAEGRMAMRTMASQRTSPPESLDPAWIAGVPLAEFGEPLEEPLFLVCVNGKRDACCAVRGRVALAALAEAEPGRAWECTHLGGHRFAANLVCLPDGIVYGRVPPPDAARLAALYRDGRVDPSLLRGRSAWPAPAQVAEQHIRVVESLSGLHDVELLSSYVEADSANVTLSVRGEPRSIALRSEATGPPRPTSCRGDELEEPLHWRVVDSAS